MESAVVIRGRLVGPRSVELEEPVADLHSQVEVIVRKSDNGPSLQTASLADFLRSIPVGVRTREELDRQLREERDAWGD
jgi:hypothetical protein